MTSVGTVIATSTLDRTLVYPSLVSQIVQAAGLGNFDEAICIYDIIFWVLHQRIRLIVCESRCESSC